MNTAVPHVDLPTAELLCSAAIGYADLGYMVLPLHGVHSQRCACGKKDCSSPAKHPHGRYAPNGLKSATCDGAVICTWFNSGRFINIGIRTGPESGIVVLDMDPRHGGDESFKQLGELPATATVATGGGGKHFYFKYPEGVEIRNSAGKLGAGLDVRGSGGYIVAPPSSHISGGVYRRLTLLSPLPEIPPKLLEKLVQIEADRNRDKDDPPPLPAGVSCGTNAVTRAEKYAATWEGVGEGQRNAKAMHHAACLRRDFALSEEEAWPILCSWNSLNNPPLGERELRECLKNGFTYGTHAVGEKLTTLPFKYILPLSKGSAQATAIAATAFARTDAGRGELFAHRHSDIVRFCRDRGGWWRYDGQRWTTKGALDQCRQLAILDARQLVVEAGNIGDDDKRRATIKYAIKCESAAKVQATLSMAESMPPLMVIPDVFDADPYLLNCANGTIDLRSGALRPHAAGDLITKVTGVEYDPKAESPLWTEHLRRVLGGDASLMEFVQAASGYSATGDVSEEVLFLIHGPAAGGKTTTIEALKTALGDYALTCDFDTFLKRQAGGIRNDIARLAGARLVVSVEVDEGQTLAEGLVKQLTGGDKVSARFLHQEFFEFKPEGKLWLVCNDAPKARDTDDALWRRILRVPFEHSIPKAERDSDVKRLLTDPDVGGPVVLAWIVAGCQQWRQTGLVIPTVVENATRALRESQDPLRDFFEDQCEFSPEVYVPIRIMRQAYEKYASEQGIRYTLGPREFNKRLEARSCTRKTRRYRELGGGERNEKCWIGVSLDGYSHEAIVTETFRGDH